MEFEIFRHGDVVGRQELRLVFERGHNSLRLLGIEVEPLLAGRFGGIHHRRERHVRMS